MSYSRTDCRHSWGTDTAKCSVLHTIPKPLFPVRLRRPTLRSISQVEVGGRLKIVVEAVSARHVSGS